MHTEGYTHIGTVLACLNEGMAVQLLTEVLDPETQQPLALPGPTTFLMVDWMRRAFGVDELHISVL